MNSPQGTTACPTCKHGSAFLGDCAVLTMSGPCNCRDPYHYRTPQGTTDPEDAARPKAMTVETHEMIVEALRAEVASLQGTTDHSWLCRCGHVDAEHDSEDRSCDAWVERGQRCPCPSFDGPQGTTDPEDVRVRCIECHHHAVEDGYCVHHLVASLRAELEQLRPVVRAGRLVAGLYESTPLHEDEFEQARVEVLTAALDALAVALANAEGVVR
jgi:hypothetical protein